MIFKSDQVKAQWDTWAYYHQGTYYLYYLITEDSPGEGFGVATSSDGVHWHDHGWALHASDKMVRYLGTGAVWKSTDYDKTGRFICNYSEHREEEDGTTTQNILFAWSTDLIHWTKYGDDRMFQVDERYYKKLGRWDCIYPSPRPGNGYYGTWTATPKGRKGVGIGFSEDGLTWAALEPPDITPGADEAGAFFSFGEKIYAMFGVSGEMVSYVADVVTGPYRRAEKNALLLRKGHTYFSRFLPTPTGLLVNHHAMSGRKHYGQQVRDVTYAAPFKRALVDAEGNLRFHYWEGNEALKDKEVKITPRAATSLVTFLTDPQDFGIGIVAEGVLQLARKDKPSPGLYLYVDNAGYAVCVLGNGLVEMGPMDPFGGHWKACQPVDRERSFGSPVHFRLLARRGMLEFYLDDHFIECYTMGCPDGKTVRLGTLGGMEDNTVTDLHVSQMSLPGR